MVYLTIAVDVPAASGKPDRRAARPRIEHDMLDAALILVVVSTLVAATPAILQGATEILILQRLPLWLVGLAATLSMVERLPEIDECAPPGFWERRLSRLLSRGIATRRPMSRRPCARKRRDLALERACAAKPA